MTQALILEILREKFAFSCEIVYNLRELTVRIAQLNRIHIEITNRMNAG